MFFQALTDTMVERHLRKAFSLQGSRGTIDNFLKDYGYINKSLAAEFIREDIINRIAKEVSLIDKKDRVGFRFDPMPPHARYEKASTFFVLKIEESYLETETKLSKFLDERAESLKTKNKQ